MKNLQRLFFICLLFIGISASAQFKQQGIGGALIYNLPVKGWGLDVRYERYIGYNFVLVPKADYYFWFNDIHELNLGADLQLRVESWRTWGGYLLAGPNANFWLNHKNSPDPNAQLLNFTAEFGVGIGKNYDCVRPFAEYRVNYKYCEANIRAGAVFYFGDCQKEPTCPTYDRGKW